MDMAGNTVPNMLNVSELPLRDIPGNTVRNTLKVTKKHAIENSTRHMNVCPLLSNMIGWVRAIGLLS